ncbi:MAG: type II toxin-antitoxin system VapC family toxin [Terriglobia bacterium]|jgi:predicted nucleic acid-binding protein
MNLVVDASVAVKWLVKESDTDKAEALLESCRLGKYDPVAPELLVAEVGSVLSKRVRQGSMKASQAEFQFDRFNRIRPVLKPLLDLAGRAFKLALVHQHSVYDCLYVALALEAQCELVTADEKLFRTFSPSYPNVKLLRLWP